MQAPLFAELSTIGIVIAVIVAIVASFLKRRQENEEWELPPELKPKREQPQAPPAAARSWEEELRRVLEERPAPPPIMRHEPSPPPPPLPEPEEYETPIEAVLPTRRPHIEPVFDSYAGVTGPTHHVSDAAAIERRVQERFHHATTHRVAAASVHHAELAPEIREVLTSVHTFKGARAAILASVILGPPRAFEV